MRNRTRIGCMSELGGSPLASSIAVIPKDQISAYKGRKTALPLHRATTLNKKTGKRVKQDLSKTKQHIARTQSTEVVIYEC